MKLRRTGSLVAALAIAFAATALVACRGSGEDTITVFAAASLTDAFGEIGEAFESANPGTSVEFNFGSSAALAVQIIEGAPADVFASANTTQMAVVVDENEATNPALFATNRLAVVVPADSSEVGTFADLAKPGIRLVLAAPEVPVGGFAWEVLENASALPSYGADFGDRVLENLVSNETDVRAVLTKVQLGEADAGIVYTTDAAIAAGDVTLVEIPDEVNVVAQYPIAVLTGAANGADAEAFVAFVLSPTGREILEHYGFGLPQ